jgi:hypothetical protein
MEKNVFVIWKEKVKSIGSDYFLFLGLKTLVILSFVTAVGKVFLCLYVT